MSSGRLLLIWPASTTGTAEHWLRLGNGQGVGHGGSWAAIPPSPNGKAEDIILVVPATEVALHWVELPSASAAQAQAAGRLLASEVSAAPIDTLHVAVGEVDEKGLRCLAVADTARIAQWLEHAQSLGLDPDAIIPEPLLLVAPEEGVTHLVAMDYHVLRGKGVGFGGDPALAEMLATSPVRTIDSLTFETEIEPALEQLPVDMRQGIFGRRRKWGVEWAVVRRLAIMAAVLFATILIVQVILITRYNLAAGRLERQQEEIARSALPRGTNIANAPAQVAERLTALRGGGKGFSTTAAILFQAVRDAPNVEIQALQFDQQGRLRGSLSSPSSSDIAGIAHKLEAAGFQVDPGQARNVSGRQIVDLTMSVP